MKNATTSHPIDSIIKGRANSLLPLWFLRGILVALAMLTMPMTQAQQQIKNSGLELWVSGANMHPAYFSSLDFVGLGGAVTRTTDAHSGQYAALLTSSTSMGSSVPGLLVYGSDSISFGLAGWPFTGKPDKLRFWYKYHQEGADSGYGLMVFTQYVNGSRNYVAYADVYIKANTPNYTLAEAPVIYQWPNAQPDSVYLEFASSMNNVTPGSALTVDDISLVYGNLEVPLSSKGKDLEIYPNPAKSNFQVNLPDNDSYTVEVRDISGRSVFASLEVQGAVQLSCADWAAGRYTVIARRKEHCLSRNLVISR